MIIIARWIFVLFCCFSIALNAIGAEPIQCKLRGMAETVAFSPDGKTIAGGGADRMVRIWDATDGKQLYELPIFEPNDQSPGVTTVAFSPDGKTLAVAAAQGKPVTFWDAASGTKLDQTLELNHSQQFAWGIAFSPDGSSLAAAGPDGLRVWDLAANKPQFVIPLGDWFVPRKVVFSPDGSLLATEAGEIFKSGSGKVFWYDRKLAANSVAFSPDGKLLVTGRYDLDIWDLQTKKKILEHADKKPGVIFCLSVNGDTIATGGASMDVRLWNINTGTPTGLLKGHTDQVVALSFSPDGKRLASASLDKSVLIWTLERDATKSD